MIGWKSKRIVNRHQQGLIERQNALLKPFLKNFSGISETNFANQDCVAGIKSVSIGTLNSEKSVSNSTSILI
jgi:hypothetical protein